MRYIGREKEYKKEWYLNNKGRLKLKFREYYLRHQEEIKRKSSDYKLNNKEKIRDYYNDPIVIKRRKGYMKIWEKENILKRRRYNHVQRMAWLKSWEGFLPAETNCQICGKKIFYNKKKIKDAIHFDHRREGEEVIKDSPHSWLRSHKRNPENEKIWESCKFGMLCGRCNVALPTSNRKAFIDNVLKYMEGR